MRRVKFNLRGWTEQFCPLSSEYTSFHSYPLTHIYSLFLLLACSVVLVCVSGDLSILPMFLTLVLIGRGLNLFTPLAFKFTALQELWNSLFLLAALQLTSHLNQCDPNDLYFPKFILRFSLLHIPQHFSVIIFIEHLLEDTYFLVIQVYLVLSIILIRTLQKVYTLSQNVPLFQAGM